MNIIRNIKESIKIKPFDWLLVIGLVLAPMTSLRTWKVGPAEALVFIWSIRQIQRKFVLTDIAQFYLTFLVAQIIGTLWCLIIAPNEAALALYASWFYLAFVSIFMYAGLSRFKLDYCKKLFALFANISVIWYAYLLYYAQNVGPRFMGARLWYGTERFSGGATNPHQIAILMCGLMMYFMVDFFQGKARLLNIVKMMICYEIVSQTKSSTGMMAIFLGIFIGFILLIAKSGKDTRKSAQIFTVELFVLFIICFVLHEQIYERVYNWIASDKNGLGRLYLYSQTRNVFIRSPFFGLGPGWHVHSPTGRPIEIHNTYLEVIAGAGLVGLYGLIIFTIKQVRKVWRVDPVYLSVIVAIYAYGLSGFAMRKLVYWGLTAFVLVIAEKEAEENGSMVLNKN